MGLLMPAHAVVGHLAAAFRPDPSQNGHAHAEQDGSPSCEAEPFRRSPGQTCSDAHAAYPVSVSSDLRILGVHRPAAVAITVDGRSLRAYPGESVAATLIAVEHRTFGAGPDADRPRTAFCMMGVCQQCLVVVDGVTVQACLTPVRAGMVVERR